MWSSNYVQIHYALFKFNVLFCDVQKNLARNFRTSSWSFSLLLLIVALAIGVNGLVVNGLLFCNLPAW